MGHHIWKIILSKSVFTRVTDGQRLVYYSAYVLAGLVSVTGVAVAIHFLVVDEGLRWADTLRKLAIYLRIFSKFCTLQISRFFKGASCKRENLPFDNESPLFK